MFPVLKKKAYTLATLPEKELMNNVQMGYSTEN